MAWNQPGNGERPPTRGREELSLEESLKRWQKRLQGMWQPGGRRHALLGVVALAIVAVWFASGFYQVDSAERGVVQQFGRYVNMVGPGHGWHWPWPIQTVTKVDIETIDSVDSRSLMLTADLDLLNIGWSAQYRRTDPLRVLFQLRDPDATLRQDAQSVLRRAVAATPMERVLAGDGRQRLADGVRATLQQTLDREQAGMMIESFNLTDVDVPDSVQASQRDVDKAQMDSDRARQQAQDYADQILPQAQNTAARARADAQNYQTQVVAAAEGDAERFDAVLDAYTQAPAITRDRLYIDTVRSVLERSHKIIVDTRAGTGNMIYLPLDKLLAEHTQSASANGSVAGAGSGDSGVGSGTQPGTAEVAPAPAGGEAAEPSSSTVQPAAEQSGSGGTSIGDDAARTRARPER